ncbi:MAG: TIGR03790 family protein [Verrucomicrobiota bacterium]
MKIIFCFSIFLTAGFSIAVARESGESVVVVYNSKMPGSKDVAQHYAERRNVPVKQIIGLDLPTSETMSRAEYRTQLEKPLLKYLENKKLFLFRSDLQSVTNDKKGAVPWKLAESKIRYAVLCYGVPSRITRDSALSEPDSDKLKLELRRNEASVDSELALLPLNDPKRMLSGPASNPFYGATNGAAIHPTNGLLMVARLDGPSAPIARGLVDKAIEAEKNGLWGRAYFDLRGVTNEYKLGDDWIRNAAEATRRFGFETIVDEKPETFSTNFPMSEISLYAGWYDGNVSGPFASAKVEWMPGAFAYHLHSFSAATLRSATQNWVGPLLASGVTATMGAVDEPYLIGTPDLGVFFSRWLLLGFSYGEAAYASQGVLSWQTTVIGDPLYRPFVRPPKELHEDLQKRGSKLVEWSHLRVVDLNIVQGFPLAEVVAYLEAQPITKTSATLTEKLGDLYWAQGKPASANSAYKDALKMDLTPQHKARLEKYVADTAEAAAKSLEKARAE